MTIEDIWLAHLRAIVEKEAQAAGGSLRDGYKSVASKTTKSTEYIYQLYKGKPKANGAPRKVSVDFAKALGKHYAEGRNPDWINIPPVNTSTVLKASETGANELAAIDPPTKWPFKAVSLRRFLALPREAQLEIENYLDAMVLNWERKTASAKDSRKHG